MFRDIYFDNSATTRAYDDVIDYMSKINGCTYANPSSLHKKGIEAEKLIRKAREAVAGSLNVESKEIFFTSGGTEANNLAIRGYLEANPRKGNHIITSTIEHPSVLEVFKYLSTKGYSVDFISVNNKGMIDLAELESKICDDTALISFILVNNEVGAIQPIEDIVRIRNKINRETAIHIDAVQAYGKINIYPKKLGIDMMSISSHKIHGPKGSGALYCDKKVKLKPLILGGGQESNLRSGTENVSGVCGFGLAVDKIFENINQNYDKVYELNNVLKNELRKIENCSIFEGENILPYILNVSFENVKSEVLLHHLEEKNIFVSTGSACSSRKNIHSHVLKAVGLDSKYIEGAIRMSFSSFNEVEEVFKTINILKEILPKIEMRRGGKK